MCKHPTCQGECRRPVKEKKKYKIPKVSKTRAAINRLYFRAAAKFRAMHPLCEINAPGCSRETQGVHHLKGKATTELLLNQDYWMPACNNCNGYVEDNSAWAFANGFKLSKFN